jgi:predicted GNAT family acetyltransferase
MLAGMEAATQVKTHHNATDSQFEIHDGETVIGKAEYLPSAAGTQRVFFHTEVDDAYKGQGLAQRLAQAALDETVADGRRIVPICAFIAGYLRKHGEYAEHVDEPTTEHRAAVRAAGGDA